MNVSNFKHSLSLQNRFIINNELFEIDPVFINNLIKEVDTLRVKLKLPAKNYKFYNNYFHFLYIFRLLLYALGAFGACNNIFINNLGFAWLAVLSMQPFVEYIYIFLHKFMFYIIIFILYSLSTVNVSCAFVFVNKYLVK